ncbi:MerR family transcriptional regulator (plasmid) [Phormidium sp. CLA17]|uniref:MerR family transcriptional regulator n=1 Tax=Leptolyngbya sp. Cla-17 TaxID=2803751 RepID=UPI001490DC4C|nr:MerR family transcriptional regulator [Leptolyngbya sp. Cla-17]MBM0745216.1 MerR family transcriptional regulator [Leptolyngbya sp. Cla-17]
MLIGELSKKTGLSKDTIRFYEKMGLIEAKARQAGTRTYMEFSSEILERVVIITQGKSLGFTLNEIKHLIETWGSVSMPLSEKLKVIDRKFDEITEKMRQLEEIKTYLIAKRNIITQESGNSRVSTI